MATTTNYSWNLPTVGGNQDAWGDLLNANWTAIDTLLGGTNATEFAILDGATVTTTELNYVSGVTGPIQTQINAISAGGFPSGGIVMWSGAIGAIPSGWLLCDGTNGTPDLRDRFVVGAGSTYSVGGTGGAATVALSEAEMPSHTHSFSGTTSTGGAHQHSTLASYVGSFGTISSGAVGLYGGSGSGTRDATSSNGSHSHSFSGTTGATGSGNAHENRPPYYALAYIMKA